MELSIFITLFAILFGGLLGVYALGFRVMSNVNKKIDGHVQDTKIHVDPEHPMVTLAVFNEVQKRNELHFDTLASGQNEIKASVNKIWEKMNQ